MTTLTFQSTLQIDLLKEEAIAVNSWQYLKRSLIMKTLLIIPIFLLSAAYSQCDANEDGLLNVLDVVIEVDCILTDCWEAVPLMSAWTLMATVIKPYSLVTSFGWQRT